MGLLFKSNIKKQLEKLYTTIFQSDGISPAEAKRTARSMLEEAKREAKKEGTLNLPQNLGDILLEKETTDEKYKSMLAKLRSEGVRDEDIRWWWNMNELERRMMQKADFMSRATLFLKLREEDMLPEEQAAKRVGRSFPIFGDTDDTILGTGKDSPLPYELKDRISIYVKKRYQIDPEQFKSEIEASSSFNALIRKEIEKGNI